MTQIKHTQLVATVGSSGWLADHAVTAFDALSLAGNTAGVLALISSGTMLLAGGNNVTLSQDGQSVTISGGAGGAAGSNTLGMSNLGNTSGTSGVVSGSAIRYVFAGGNNVTLSQSLDAGSVSGTITISAANETQTVPPIGTAVKDVGSAGSTGTITRFAPEDHAHRGLNQFQITGNTANTSNLVYGSLYLAGGNNVTLSQVSGVGAATVTISAANETQTVPPIATAVKPVQTSGSTGTITRFAPEDHAHQGVAGWDVNGIASTFFGTQQLSAGNLMSIATGGNTSRGSAQIINLLSSSDQALDVLSTSSAGTNASRFALADHQHRGLAQFQITGNTSNTSNLVYGSLYLAGGNNITLSQVSGAGAATVTISGAAAGGAQTAISGISQSQTMYTSGTVLFSEQANITINSSVNGASQYLRFSVAAAGGGGTQSYYEPVVRGATVASSVSPGTVYFQPFFVPYNVSMYRMNLLFHLTTQATTTQSFSASVSSQTSTRATALGGTSGTVMLFSRVSTGTAANSSQLISFFSNSYSQQLGESLTVTWSTNASSATASFSTSMAMTFHSSIDSAGGLTTGSRSSSSSGSFTSTSTNQNSFSSSAANSFGSLVMSGVRPMLIPFATSLSAGEYWLAHIQSTNSSSTSIANVTRFIQLGPASVVAYSSNTSGYVEIGSTASFASSNLVGGWGSYSASSQTSTTIPLSQISNMSQYVTWFNVMAAVK